MSPPNHIAIIMDGNRRWATERNLPKLKGHTEGAKNLKVIARAASDARIPYLTVWALSTENLKNRTEAELKHLFALIKKLPEYLSEFTRMNTRIHLIGDTAALPHDVQKTLHAMTEETKTHTGMVLTLAINYGGRDEIRRAVRRIVASGINADSVTEDVFAEHLDTAGLPEVDLIIRTGGDQRLSGYLPWQSTYAELYFTDTKWPAFTAQEFLAAIDWFGKQKRNKGK